MTGSASAHYDLIIALAAKYKLPAIYPFRYMVTDGGVISHGFDVADQYRRRKLY